MHDEEIEILREQLSSLKQEVHLLELKLHEQREQMQELEAELHSTNQELCRAVNTPYLSLDEAKKIAKDLIAADKPPFEAIAELLSTIYACEVPVSQSDSSFPVDTDAQQPHAKQYITSTERRKVVLVAKYTELQAQTEDLREQFHHLLKQVKARRRHFHQFAQHFQAPKVNQTKPLPSDGLSVDPAISLD